MARMIEGAGGGGKGGGGARTPTEAPDDLFSDSTVYVLDAVSEGEIEGWAEPAHPLRCVYFDGTPIENADGTLNFEGVSVTLRAGEPDQTAVPGFAAVESETPVGLAVKATAPVARTITSEDADAARVTLYIPQLVEQQSDGDVVRASVRYAIDVQAGGDPAETVVEDTLRGKTTSGFVWQWRVELPPVRPCTITVRRITPDSESAVIQNEFYFQSVTEIIDAKLSYPNTAYVALAIPAESVGGRLPERTYRLKGIKCLIPSNYDPVARSYAGIWDGTFQRAHTDNPAWVLYTALVDPRWGVGERVDPAIIDKWSFYEAAVYNDAPVDDGAGGSAPRYTCNGPMTRRARAWSQLTELASVMRGALYWGKGAVVLVQDRPRDPVKLVTNANVIEGRFDYATPSLAARHSTVAVSFRDQSDQHALKPGLYYDDPEAVARYGFREAEIELGYCDNRAEALRAAKWLVETDQSATETVNYRAGWDHAAVRPGDAIEISDKHRVGFRTGGRLRAVETTRLRLDHPVTLDAGRRYDVTVSTPSGAMLTLALASAQGGALEWVDLAAPIAPGEIVPGAVFALVAGDGALTRWRVLSNAPTAEGFFDIAAVLEDPGKWDRVERDIIADEPAPWIEAPTGPLAAPSGLVATELLYLDGSAVRSAIEVTVAPPADPRVAYVEIQAQRPGSAGWSPLGIGSALSARLLNTAPGAHRFRARAIDPLAVAGAWREIGFLAQALLAPPAAPTGLRVALNGGQASLTWEPVADLDLAQYEIRHSGDPASPWAAAQFVSRVAAPATQAMVAAFPGRYFVKALDLSGASSTTAAEAVLPTGAVTPANVVSTLRHGTAGASGWAGAFVDATVAPEGLELRDDGGFVPAGVFTSASTVDLGEVFASRLSAALTAYGRRSDDFIANWGLLAELDSLTGVAREGWSTIVEVRSTSDDPAGAPTWSEWAPLTAGEVVARAFQARIKLGSSDPKITPVVTALTLTVDMPDRVDGANDVSVPVGGLTVTYSPAFRAKPALAITAQELATGDRHVITGASAAGFTIRFFNSSGAGVARSMDWIASGYGRVL